MASKVGSGAVLEGAGTCASAEVIAANAGTATLSSHKHCRNMPCGIDWTERWSVEASEIWMNVFRTLSPEGGLNSSSRGPEEGDTENSRVLEAGLLKDTEGVHEPTDALVEQSGLVALDIRSSCLVLVTAAEPSFFVNCGGIDRNISES